MGENVNPALAVDEKTALFDVLVAEAEEATMK
jgi:hypothetical protein